jgi:hypothetical protein
MRRNIFLYAPNNRWKQKLFTINNPLKGKMHMTKIFTRLSIGALLMATSVAASAVPVKISLGSSTPYINLTDKSSGKAVDLGDGSTNFSLDLNPGSYTIELLGSDANKTPYGTIVMDVPESTEYTTTDPYTVSVARIMIKTGNKDADGNYFTLGKDMTIKELSVSAQQGAAREITYVETVSSNVPTIAFPVFVGDTYRVTYAPDATLHPTYSEATVTSTISSTSGETKTLTMGYYIPYSITVPSAATLFVGKKIKHYVPFEEIKPDSVAENGDTKTYTFKIPSSNPTCNYRVSMPGVMTHAGKFGASASYSSLVFTEAGMREHGTPDYYNHTLTDNQNGNLADVLMNINERGHLCMKLGDTKQIVANRVWQLVDDQSNNYYVEPDYHYTVLDENFKPSDAVITIDADGNITPKAAGTAIVQVTYDACYAHGYNGLDGFSTKGKEEYDFWFGSKWSALWAENTGTFVVTVGSGETADSETFVPNYVLDKSNSSRTNKTIDSELDVMYYMESESGYKYTYKPTGAAKVELANPNVDSEKNTVSYDGFKVATANADGSYTLLLTYGRNIIRTTGANGEVAYQVLSAKPIGYEITNTTDTASTVVRPGNKIEVKFHGFYHPVPKLAGIYNQSANLYFAAATNEGGLILGPGQYTFAGNPAAQTLTITVPNDIDSDALRLDNGAIFVKGYGSKGATHRGISRATGVNPNFTASVTSEYWGAVPDVDIPVVRPTGGIKINVKPANADLALVGSDGYNYKAGSDGIFYVNPGTYTYSVDCEGYFTAAGTIDVEDNIVTKDITLTAPTAEQTTWDGTQRVKPAKVTAAEAATDEFADMEGYYKVSNGYEMAWVQYTVNASSTEMNVVLTNDIDLGNHNWSPMGTNKVNYSGAFEGNNHSIRNLNISAEATDYVAFIGVTALNSKVRNLSVYGEVKNTTGSYTAGIIGKANAGVFENLTNYANVTSSGKNVAGVIANVSASSNQTRKYSNLVNNGNITATTNVAGVIAYFNGYYLTYNFNNIVNNGTIKAVVSDNVNTPTVGGLLANITSGAAVSITDSYNTGEIINEKQKYGETGAIVGDLMDCDNDNYFTRVYNIGKVPENRPVGTVSATIEAKDAYMLSTESDSTAYEAYVKFVSAEAFANGEVAWALREGFGQTLGTDSIPTFTGAKVYKVTYTTSLDEETEKVVYTNGTLPEVAVEGYTAAWLASKGGEAVSSVSEDSTLYVNYSEVSGVIDSVTADANISVDGNTIHVNGMAGSTLQVYSANGALVASHYVNGDTFTAELNLAHGVYVARCGALAHKFVK